MMNKILSSIKNKYKQKMDSLQNKTDKSIKKLLNYTVFDGEIIIFSFLRDSGFMTLLGFVMSIFVLMFFVFLVYQFFIIVYPYIFNKEIFSNLYMIGNNEKILLSILIYGFLLYFLLKQFVKIIIIIEFMYFNQFNLYITILLRFVGSLPTVFVGFIIFSSTRGSFDIPSSQIGEFLFTLSLLFLTTLPTALMLTREVMLDFMDQSVRRMVEHAQLLGQRLFTAVDRVAYAPAYRSARSAVVTAVGRVVFEAYFVFAGSAAILNQKQGDLLKDYNSLIELISSIWTSLNPEASFGFLLMVIIIGLLGIGWGFKIFLSRWW